MTSPRSVRVFYEDSISPLGLKDFGPHKLLCACVEDRLSWPPHSARHTIEPSPMNGVSKLLSELERNLHRLAGGSRVVIAVVDDDQIREELVRRRWASSPHASRLRPDEVERTLRRQLLSHAKLPEESPDLQVVALQRNTESLVEAVGEVLYDPDLLQAALRKQLTERDALLARAAHAPDPTLRPRILEKIPSFARLVELCVEALQTPAA